MQRLDKQRLIWQQAVLKKAIFLDRDGVINRAIVKNGKPYPPASLAELVVPVETGPALQALKAAGFYLIGATNQPDVARGTTLRATVEEIHQILLDTLPLDEIGVCYHDDSDACNCRKPLPGLLTTAAAKYNIDLKNSFMIGDRWKDIEAGQTAGCRCIWLDFGYAEKGPVKIPDFTASSLTEATDWILGEKAI